MPGRLVKTCTRCERRLGLDAFHAKRGSERMSMCKPCQVERNRENRAARKAGAPKRKRHERQANEKFHAEFPQGVPVVVLCPLVKADTGFDWMWGMHKMLNKSR